MIFLLLCKITKKNNQVESYRHSILLDIIHIYTHTHTNHLFIFAIFLMFHFFKTFTLALDFHVGPISTNGYSRPNLKVQKKQGTWRAVIAKCYYIEVNKRCTFCANFVLICMTVLDQLLLFKALSIREEWPVS